MASGLPCTFFPNIGRNELAALYGRSAILIHAAGYGVDIDEFPQSLEHFGITPVEASQFWLHPGRLRARWSPRSDPCAGREHGLFHH